MSLPKRPFTTSSLTSSLKSTLANQPLLNNLTNIDKLSSQASSLAHKAPFFGAINQQFQQHHQQSEPQRHLTDPTKSTVGQANVTTGGNIGSSSSGSASTERISSNNRSDDMNRDVHKLNAGPGIRAPTANAPDVDMSHLTEEERAMIQSVMAKAEMADMGLPVDTSSPGSTNLPSSTSQALTQHRDQQRQEQQLRQQQQQQQHRQQQQQLGQQQPQAGFISSGSQPIEQQQSMQSILSQNDNTHNTVTQVQHPTQELGLGRSEPMRGVDNLDENVYTSRRAEQPINFTAALSQQQEPSMNMNAQSGQCQAVDSRVNPPGFGPPASTMQPDRGQLFNTGSIADSIGAGACYQNDMVNTNVQSSNSGIINPTQSSYYQVMADQNNNNIGNVSSYDMQQQSQLPNQPFVDMPQSQAPPTTVTQFECTNQNMPPQVVQFGAVPNTQMIGNLSQFGQSFDQQYPGPQENSQMNFNQTHQAGAASQNFARQSLTSAPNRQQPKYVSASDLDYEQAFSDRDQRQTRSKHVANQGVKPMSRHESMETGRRSARRSRNRDALELQAYDLAQRSSSGGSQKSRQLPQPGYSNHGNARQQSTEPNLQSSSEYFLEERSSRKNRDARKSPVSQPERARARAKPREGKLDKKIAHESSCPTESDLDDDLRTESESDDRRRHLAAVSHTKEIKEKKEQPSVDKETTDKKTNIVDSPDKSEQSLKLLSELKLTEQANQVMEQQQLLIKQSQELIKLQQAQLEQQAEINKTLSEVDRDKKQAGRKDDTEKRKSNRSDQEVEGADDTDRTGSKIDSERNTEHERNSTTKSREDRNIEGQDYEDKSRDRISSKSRADNDSDTDRKRATRNVTKDVDSTSDLDSNWRSGNYNTHSRTSRAKSPVNSKVRSMSALTRKQGRDSNHSPTDTTDSDIDLMSQTSSRHDRNKASAKLSKPVARIRREPKGLPPSPLPVAAAIQLHQMQQKHRNQTALANSRTNQLRSRSVTSSPNHMLDRMMSGYMTDTQHARPSSPDTMSEYGGQRRRKRLPEPPTNVVPITPSMVRRMVQANRAAAINSSRPFNINTNSSVLPPTSLSRTSIFRNDFERRPSLNMDYKPSIDIGGPTRYGSSSLLSNVPSTSGLAQQTLPKQLGDSQAPSSNTMPVDSSGFNYHHKLASYDNIDDHIPRADQISDVKETPELDKLISNLDEYYRLDGPMSRLTSSTRVPYTTASAYKPSSIQYDTSVDRIQSSSPVFSGSYSGVGISANYPISTSSKTRYTSPSYLTSSSYDPLARQKSELIQAQATHQGYNNQRYQQQSNLDGRLNLNSIDNYMPAASATDHNYLPSTSYSNQQYRPVHHQPIGSYFDDALRMSPRTGASMNNAHDYRAQPVAISTSPTTAKIRNSYEPATRNFTEAQMQSSDRTLPSYSQSSYLDSRARVDIPTSDYNQQRTAIAGRTTFPEDQDLRSNSLTDRYTNNLPPITKDDIINNGPKYGSIGYRFRTENQNKYVTESRTPIECLQSRYPYPYKRTLLSKNPKDRLGNGIGVKILGGQPLSNIYDKVNKCILTSGAFVTEVFQSSRVYFMDEMHEGDQVVEWNGVNLCNRSDGEVQQILFSQFSDDEVEIIYLSRQKFKDAYGTDLILDSHSALDYAYDAANGTYDMYAAMNKPHNFNIHGHQTNEPFKRSIRRKLSLSSISHMWSK